MVHECNGNDIEDNNMKIYTETENMINSSNGYQYINNEGIPTQTHGLVTTVPQNISSLKIGDKHTPTRNSLRHSRMIVLTKTSKMPIKYVPTIVKHHDRAQALMWIILIVGIIMSFECSSLQIYAPNTKTHLNPFYATIPILFSGIFGFVHLRCCRKEYPGVRRNMCEKFIKLLSITTSVVASVMATVYIYHILMHLLSFTYLDCAQPDFLTNTCKCEIIDNMENPLIHNNWNYVDLSCFELYYIYNVILGITALTCMLIAVLEIYYLILHWDNQPEILSSKPPTNYVYI